MIALYAILTACIHQCCRTHDVRLQEDARSFNRVVNVRLRSKVYHDIRLLFFEKLVHRCSVEDISFDKAEIGIVHYRL